MPRIPESNLRFRTKEQICADVSTVLRSSLHYGTKYAVLSEVTWVWSEFNGKYVGCKYWSKAAWRLRGGDEKLVHEHLVPKKEIIGQLVQLKNPSPESVREVLERFCIGVVVTAEEDQRLNKLGLRAKMPEGWDGQDPWARYVVAKIKVVAVK
jgi:hypothetical protein